MGPMMGGGPWWGGGFGWLVAVVVVLAVVALVLGGVWRPGAGGADPRPRAPEQLLRTRYARGELTRRQYHDALLDVLKDRYVRGELDVEEYEERLRELRREPSVGASGAGRGGEVP